MVAIVAALVPMDSLRRGRTWRERLCMRLSVMTGDRVHAETRRTRFAARTTRAGSTLMLKLNNLGILGGSLRCQPTLLRRSFALSRFPDKGAPSGGRTRPRTLTPRVRPTLGTQINSQKHLAQDESTVNTSESPLWEEGQRHPSSDPEDGLKRLLQNNALVVTRSVT